MNEPIIVSTGTTNPRRLVRPFLGALEERSAPAYEEFRNDWQAVLSQLAHPRRLSPGDADDYEAALEDMFDDLYRELEMSAPEGMYWGTSEGDGACFGYWPVEEEEEV